MVDIYQRDRLHNPELPVFKRKCDERIEKLEAENEKLRDALEKIWYYVGSQSVGVTERERFLMNIAKEALKEQ